MDRNESEHESSIEILDELDDDLVDDEPPPVRREPARTLADAGDHTDESYVGSVDTSPLSLDYFRSKFVEFQTTLNALDASYQAAQRTMALPGIDEETYGGLQSACYAYEDKRATLKRTAELLNAGASLANAAGVRMPVLSIPQSLGLPFLVPVAIAGAVAAAVSLVVWGNGMIATFRAWLLRAQAYSQLAPEVRAELASELARIDAAQNASSGTGLSTIAGAAKWIAIAAVAYLAWNAFQRSRGGSSD